jgi:hypothetical protein
LHKEGSKAHNKSFHRTAFGRAVNSGVESPDVELLPVSPDLCKPLSTISVECHPDKP